MTLANSPSGELAKYILWEINSRVADVFIAAYRVVDMPVMFFGQSNF